MTKRRIDAVEVCEGILRKEIENNEKNNIWPSINATVRVLLRQSRTMAPVYEELCELLPLERYVTSFLDALISTFTFWDEDDMRKAREERGRLIQINEDIADLATRLGDLLREREDICNRAGFGCERETGLAALFDRAGEHNPLYTLYPQDEFIRLTHRYEHKYWPSIEDLLSELASDAEQSEVYAHDAETEAGTSSRKPSQYDVLRAFQAKLDDYALGGELPSKLRLSDSAMATILNCITELDADSLVTAEYIKSFRQKERARAKSRQK
ncbi:MULTISPECIES: hypothetical protein [Aeromonas]|uniref:Uncharacterized protein n=1 Tax=Aeromonas caviae TaxID=648 RepID=A0AA43AJW8_AERCA|nr:MULTISPECIES: hypothetical protein [Aeromonas]MBP4059130.1 hypothetical protein [Aeromonas sp. Prich7-2]MCW4617964.1 hypothetical protein [Aeromonas hydrophila]MDH0309511.1 hypothetical protein [Aeromonas caviae]MDH0319929.1 hypothetical protein [Aeromonas caviae]MDH0360206.1 hypothetical protein [Aeromonas caviae]